MSRRKKPKQKIKLNIRPIYELPKGHNNHISGSGTHNHSPKRERTRGDVIRKIINEEY